MTIYIAALLRLVRPAWPRLVVATLFAMLASASAVALLAVSAWLIVRASFHPPVLHLMVAVVAVRFFGISRGIFRYVERLVSHEAAFKALTAVRMRLYDKLERLAPSGQLWRRGDLLTRLIDDVDSLAGLITRALLPLASIALIFVGAVATTVLILPSAGLLLLVAIGVFAILVPALTAKGDRRDEAALAALRADRNARLTESILAASDPGLRSAAAGWLTDIDDIDIREERVAASSARRAGLASAITMLSIAGVVIGNWLLASQAISADQISPENGAIVILLPLALLELAQLVQPALAQVQSSRASAQRIFAVLHANQPVTPTAAADELPSPPYDVRMREVSIAWPGAERPAVRGFNLDIRPGTRVALVGPSGCGKSTVVACLLGFVDACDGHIEIGDADRSEMSGGQLRSLSSWCDQQAHLFDTTIAENVRVARPSATDEDIVAALQRAQLGDWILLLPKGIHTRVGQFGAMVSGGQRQRIAVARMLLADRPLMLIDEPTAGLDSETASALMSDTLAAARGKSLLLVTHDVDQLRDFDQIVVMKDGAVVERGRYDELAASGGAFARLLGAAPTVSGVVP